MIKIRLLGLWMIICIGIINCDFNFICEVMANESKDFEQLRSLGYVDYSPTKADPSKKGVTHFIPKKTYPGYRLYTVCKNCTAYLIDLRGNIVHSWQGDKQCKKWSYVELLSNGDILLPGAEPYEDDKINYILRMSWDGEVIWKHYLRAHHDVEITPQGFIFTLIKKDRLASPFGEEVTVRDNNLTLLSQDGVELESLSLLDVVLENDIHFKLQRVGPVEDKSFIDLLHANSVEWMRRPDLTKKSSIYNLDNVLVSLRHQDCVAIINFKDQKLVWTWGRGELLGPHDATMLDNGNILIFDNGLGRGWSRIVEVNPLTKKIVWEYRKDDFYTSGRGSSQRLPNGNTLIANSNSGQAFEVTSEEEIVWEFWCPIINEEGYRAVIVRIKQYETDFIQKLLMKE